MDILVCIKITPILIYVFKIEILKMNFLKPFLEAKVYEFCVVTNKKDRPHLADCRVAPLDSRVRPDIPFGRIPDIAIIWLDIQYCLIFSLILLKLSGRISGLTLLDSKL